MNEQTNIQIVRNLLAAKKSMEKTGEYGPITLKKIKEFPVNKVRLVQLNTAMHNYQSAQGDSKKAAAVTLMKVVIVHSQTAVKTPFCTKCGTKLPEGAAFCANCGTKRM